MLQKWSTPKSDATGCRYQRSGPHEERQQLHVKTHRSKTARAGKWPPRKRAYGRVSPSATRTSGLTLHGQRHRSFRGIGDDQAPSIGPQHPFIKEMGGSASNPKMTCRERENTATVLGDRRNTVKDARGNERRGQNLSVGSASMEKGKKGERESLKRKKETPTHFPIQWSFRKCLWQQQLSSASSCSG